MSDSVWGLRLPCRKSGYRFRYDTRFKRDTFPYGTILIKRNASSLGLRGQVLCLPPWSYSARYPVTLGLPGQVLLSATLGLLGYLGVPIAPGKPWKVIGVFPVMKYGIWTFWRKNWRKPGNENFIFYQYNFWVLKLHWTVVPWEDLICWALTDVLEVW